MEHKHQSRIEALTSIVNVINSSLDLNSILELIMDTAIDLMHAERGFIMMLDSAGNPVLRTARNIDKSKLQTELQVSTSIVSDCVREGKGILTHNALSDPRYKDNPSVMHFGLRSVISVPLMIKNQCTGAIYLDNRFKNGIFSENDLEFMDIFAHEAALAMEKARLEYEKNHIHKLLKRYVSEEVADSITEKGLGEDLKAEKCRAAIVFLDIRGFTAMSESIPPTELIPQLNDFFQTMSAIIFKHKGTLLKFLGDGFMLAWGAPVKDEEASLHAVCAALEMLSNLEELNKKWLKENKPLFNIGMGIHYGEIMAGLIGCSQRCEYAVMGDIVNTASRLESLCKEYKTPLIISEKALSETDLSHLFTEIGKVTLRGKKESIKIFKLKADK